MKRLFFFLTSFLYSSHFLFADPGVGMVIDSKGTLFYTDLNQVWMIQPNGTKLVAVPNVHSHELYLDANGNLFGEHVWYNSEQKSWEHYLWKRNAKGVVFQIKDTTEGFPEWTSLTRDIAGNQYYLERGIPSNFWKIDSMGNKTLLGSKSFSDIGRLHISNKGIVFFTNKGDLYAIPPDDSVERVAQELAEINTVWKDSSARIWNVWSDTRKNLYIATGNVIKKIDHRRLVTTIYKSANDWFPVSGLVTAEGDFWVMEYNAANEVRVNKISKEERKQIAAESRWKTRYLPLLLTAAIVVALYFLFRSKKKS